jgi:hypothetical protein
MICVYSSALKYISLSSQIDLVECKSCSENRSSDIRLSMIACIEIHLFAQSDRFYLYCTKPTLMIKPKQEHS